MGTGDDRVGRVGFAFTSVIVVLLVIGGSALLLTRGDSSESASPATSSDPSGDVTIASTSPTPTAAPVPTDVQSTPPATTVVAEPLDPPAPASSPPDSTAVPAAAPLTTILSASTVAPATALDFPAAESAVREYWTMAIEGRYESAYDVLLVRGDGVAAVTFAEFVDFWDGVATLNVVACSSALDTPQLQTVECVYDFTRVGGTGVLRERVETDWVVGAAGMLQLANQRSLGLE